MKVPEKSRMMNRGGPARVLMGMIAHVTPFALALILFLLFEADGSQPSRLEFFGQPRQLPPRLLGASLAPFFEKLLDDPAKRAAAAEVHPAYTRFPGGSDANFYNWRTGLMEIPATPSSSAYVKYWAQIAPKIARAFPSGIRYEQYKPLGDALDADGVLVLNLETSTLEEQVLWMKDLAARKLAPSRIELGNEFYIAMLMDPDSLARWPDAKTAMKAMRRTRDAIAPLVPKGAKFAVQAAPGSFDLGEGETSRYAERLRQWNAGLAPEDWFDAATVHLYPRLDVLLGRAVAGASPNDLFPVLMSHADEGTEAILGDLERLLPGKELWVTEWNMRGASPIVGKLGDPVTPDMAMHLNTRLTLALLRHPSVTVSLYFMVHFNPASPFASHIQDASGDWRMLPSTQAQAWLLEAARGGVFYRRVVESRAKALRGGGARDQRTLAIEGALFSSVAGKTLVLQNAGDSDRTVALSDLGEGSAPKSVELLKGGDFANGVKSPAVVNAIPPSGSVQLPAWSILRVRW